jgi:type I restriction enzyme S subunit
VITQSHNVPYGYKQTDVDVIPNDWDARKIGDVCRLINGRGFKPHEWQSSGLPIIRIQNLNGTEDFNHFSGSYDRKLEVPPGQLLFAWSGSRGTSFGPHIWSGPFGLLNYHTWKVEIDDSRVTKDFFLHQLRQLTSYIEGWAHGASALVHVQKWQIEGFQIPLPPTLVEQEAIAEALGDADALIESLAQLVAKKRHLKQAAMQQLLTGKTRLPGFEGEWNVRPFCEFLLAAPDYGINAPGVEFDGSLPSYLRITDIDDDGRLYNDNRVAVDHPLSSDYVLEPNDIVFARTGASVGKTYLFRPSDGRLVFAGFLIRARTDHTKLSPAFLFNFTRTRPYWNWVRMMSMRSGQPGINGNEYASLELPVPPSVEEQNAVAEILSDMDAEIEALEAKLAKARQIKQGMMQELLTGRIRLV